MKVLAICSNRESFKKIDLAFGDFLPDAEVIFASSYKWSIKFHGYSDVDLIILDTSDNYSLLKRIRQSFNLPLVVLSSFTSEIDCIRCLELGADEYIRKPFQDGELIARIKSLVRRIKKDLLNPLDVVRNK